MPRCHPWLFFGDRLVEDRKSKTGCLICRRPILGVMRRVHRASILRYAPFKILSRLIIIKAETACTTLASVYMDRSAAIAWYRVRKMPKLKLNVSVVINSTKLGVQLREEHPAAAMSLLNLPINKQRLLYRISSISTQIEMCNSSDVNIYLKRPPMYASLPNRSQ